MKWLILRVGRWLILRAFDWPPTASAIIEEMLASLRVRVRVGVGNSRFIAKQAALSAWNLLIVAPGEEKTFLSLLSSEALPLPDKEKEHLRLLGLST